MTRPKEADGAHGAGARPVSLFRLVFGAVLWTLLPLGLILASAAASLGWVLATLLFGVWDEKERDLVASLLGRKPR